MPKKKMLIFMRKSLRPLPNNFPSALHASLLRRSDYSVLRSYWFIRKPGASDLLTTLVTTKKRDLSRCDAARPEQNLNRGPYRTDQG